MSKLYRSFNQVYQDTLASFFSNEAELRQAFVEALKHELSTSRCHKYLVKHWFVPALDETIKRGRPDVRISNIVIEVEPPRAGLKEGLEQLKRYMRELYQDVEGRVKVYGLVTDGEKAELLDYNGSTYKSLQYGEMPALAHNLIDLFCSSKIPVVRVDDLLKLFGV